MSEDTLAAALAAFQAEMPTVIKSKTANTGSYSYTYADLASVSEAAHPILAKHGLAFTCLPGQGDGMMILTGRLLHTSGETVEGSLPIVGRSPQEIGSSLTYMRRYLFGCLTGIVTDDDDDGQAAERHATRPRRLVAADAVDEMGVVPARQEIMDRLDAAAIALGKTRAELTKKWRATHDIANVKALDDPDVVSDQALFTYVLSLQPYVEKAQAAANDTPDADAVICDATRPHPQVDKAEAGVIQKCTAVAGHGGDHAWW